VDCVVNIEYLRHVMVATLILGSNSLQDRILSECLVAQLSLSREEGLHHSWKHSHMMNEPDHLCSARFASFSARKYSKLNLYIYVLQNL
jgi:hypothetical protein